MFFFIFSEVLSLQQAEGFIKGEVQKRDKEKTLKARGTGLGISSFSISSVTILVPLHISRCFVSVLLAECTLFSFISI